METPNRAPRILLVEDNPADVLLFREALEEHAVACDLFVASDGEKAFQFIESAEAGDRPYPELIVLDLNLPKRTGHEVLHRLRKSELMSDIPVAILSSSAAPQDREHTETLGISAYLVKPAKLEDFMKIGKVIQNLLLPPSN